MSDIRILWIALAIFLGGCVSQPPLPPPTELPSPQVPTNQPAASVYTIGPADTLNVTVYGDAELSNRVTVSLDGSFSYPLIGRIQASSLTVQQLEGQMSQLLAKYMVDPRVSVVVEEFRSRQVNIVGEVKSPGTYPLRPGVTLLEILSEAGGPTANAGWEAVVVRAQREGTGATPGQAGREALRVDLQKLLAGEMPQAIILDSGDTVHVPEGHSFYVYGQIEKPGKYPLERDTTVLKAIAAAGGLAEFAARKRMRVRRVIEGQVREFQASLDDRLQADDLLIVPESLF